MRSRSLNILTVALAATFACLPPTPLPAQKQAGDAIEGIGPVGPAVRLHGGFDFTEGPASDGKGNVYFNDIPKDRTYKVDSRGELTVFREPSNHSNGLMVRNGKELFACEMDGRIVAVDLASKKVRVVAGGYNGKRFNAPNDLVIDKTGGVYFTDPMFRAPQPLPQGETSVYYASPKGEVTRVIDKLPNPNGVILAPDEGTLYVIPSGQAEMLAYPVEGPGKLGAGKVFCTLQQPEGKKGTGGDGLTIDEKGNLYITSGLGLQVFDPSGKMLGVIRLPEQPANATFGGEDGKTLYVTARTSLYTVPMAVRGHQFATAE